MQLERVLLHNKHGRSHFSRFLCFVLSDHDYVKVRTSTKIGEHIFNCTYCKRGHLHLRMRTGTEDNFPKEYPRRLFKVTLDKYQNSSAHASASRKYFIKVTPLKRTVRYQTDLYDCSVPPGRYVPEVATEHR